MPEGLKEIINQLSSPALFTMLSIGVFIAFLYAYRQVTRKAVGVAMLVGFFAFLALSYQDVNFRHIVAKPDNVPITMMLFLVGFFSWVAFRQAAQNDERIALGEKPLEALESDKFHVWPDLVYIEFIALILCTALLIVWSIVLKAPLEEPANPSASPNPAKAPWYFLGLQEMLVYFDPWIAGVVLPGLAIVGLMAIPYIDKNPKGNGYYTFRERPFAISVFMFGFMILSMLLIILGTFLRGPNWNFFGPYEQWDINKLEALVNVNLSELIWVRWWRTGLPHEVLGSPFLGILLREIFGIILVLAYLGVLPVVLAKKFMRKMYEEIGGARFAVMVFLLLMMMSMPIKMLLRWLFNLKYIVAIPEYFFNI